jgi:hypothetical protein
MTHMPRHAALLLATISSLAAAQTAPRVEGRWDLRVQGLNNTTYPSWLEITHSGNKTTVGRFVGRVGSARPIARIHVENGSIRFTIPPQWDAESAELRLEAKLDGEKLVGTITNPNGQTDSFTGERAPALVRTQFPAWGAPIELFNGKDLTGWATDPPGRASRWTVEGGVLKNAAGGANLISAQKFTDFKLHLEVRYPRGGNSGVYLRGRYEVQIEDTPKREWPETIDLAGVYGFLAPNEYAATGAGTWQTLDITLIGRRVTVVLNGKTVINDQIIPGITGGALDSAEGETGPIYLQGDHTAVEYRSIRLTPAK